MMQRNNWTVAVVGLIGVLAGAGPSYGQAPEGTRRTRNVILVAIFILIVIKILRT